MQNPSKARIYNSLAFLLALIALLTSWLWTYYINLFIALPSIIGALILARLANKAMPGNIFSKVNYVLIVTAIVLGLVALVIILAYN